VAGRRRTIWLCTTFTFSNRSPFRAISIDLEQKLDGGTNIDAVKRLNGEVPRTYAPRPKAEEKKAHESHELSTEQLKQCVEASNRLATKPDVLAEWRNWRRETIENLAHEESLGLSSDNMPVFIFETGMKGRDLTIGKGKSVWWKFGKPSLWRAKSVTNATKRVILTEGEIDAITLIDCGIEDDGITRVVAISGSTCNIEPQLSLFEGREVVIVGDMDEAGVKSIKSKTRILRSVASKLYWTDITVDDREIKDITELRDELGGLTVAEIEKRFLRVPDVYKAFKNYVKQKYNRDIDAESLDDGSWSQIEDESAAELYARVGRVKCIGEEWYTEKNGVWLPTDRDVQTTRAKSATDYASNTIAESRRN
jgi:hypothetical protein